MRTEEQVVYQLLHIYHGGQVSNDNVVGERLMRDFLRKHRATKINKFSKGGLIITDECFQYVGNITMEKGKYYFEKNIPPLIFLEGNGILLSKNDVDIPVMDRSSFRASLRNILNKHFPKASMMGNQLILFPGSIDLCNISLESEMGSLISEFDKEIKSFNDNEKVTVDLHAVLYDPSQAKDYDWTKDPWPTPSEIIDEITTSTTQRDLNLMLRQYVDNNVNNVADKVETNETA